MSEYRPLTLRLPDDVRATLRAAAGALDRPAWRIIRDALEAYLGDGPPLSPEEQRAVRAVKRLHK